MKIGIIIGRIGDVEALKLKADLPEAFDTEKLDKLIQAMRGA